MKKRLLMPMQLQLFASDGGSGQEGTPTNQVGSQQTTAINQEGEDGKGTDGKTFTRDDVAKMIAAETNKAKQAWEKDVLEKQKEAEKLAKMNADEKAAHERKKLEEKIAEYERKDSLHAMSKEASKMLSDAELPVSEELLELVTNEDAELTKQAVKTIIDFASKLIKENARQTTPIESSSFSSSDGIGNSIIDIANKARIIEN